MLQRILPIVASFQLVLSLSAQQYDTLWLAPATGVSTGLQNTPFPTEPGRTARTQYLVRSTQLEAIGLPSNENIVGIFLKAVDTDTQAPPCLVDLHVSMKNTVATEVTPGLELTGLQHNGDVLATTVSEGLFTVPFNISPIQWVGPGFGLLVEVSYERGVDPGQDPRIELLTDLSYTATRGLYSDQALQADELNTTTPGVVANADNSLPSFGFLVQAMTPDGSEEHALPGISFQQDVATGTVRYTLSAEADGLDIIDVSGRVVLSTRLTSMVGEFKCDALPYGTYTARASKAGIPVAVGRYARF